MRLGNERQGVARVKAQGVMMGMVSDENNRWRKRGISVVPMRYRFDYLSNFYAIVSVYAHDGAISVAHGGIECGQGINTELNVRYSGITDALKNYYIYGVTVAEVEVDVLTGEHQILHVDILEDAGESLSPEIDIGQVEGAFVMGLGYWLKEFMVYDNDTGKALTNRTWNYKPPGAKDIPIDFRIQLRKNAPNPVGVLRSKGRFLLEVFVLN
ncbi:xanthine dehydrogenase-like [Schistocerca serialis cubense]|uniref:xanthine dehydrogenase-like n=1 Tax=Schistocerca serialis cubense TaxID=2023355 RepID=UPI00214E0105|nr:xanthine dehydrogenase-like [Schistocerca serialis cubense]